LSEKVEASQECICCECGNKCGILKDGTFHCEHCFPKKQKVEDSQKTQELLGKVPSKPMTLGDWRRWWLKVEDSDVVDAFNVKLISVEGLVDTLRLTNEEEFLLQEYGFEEQNNLTQDALTVKHEILEKIARKYLKVLSKIGVEARKQK